MLFTQLRIVARGSSHIVMVMSDPGIVRDEISYIQVNPTECELELITTGHASYSGHNGLQQRTLTRGWLSMGDLIPADYFRCSKKHSCLPSVSTLKSGGRKGSLPSANVCYRRIVGYYFEVFAMLMIQALMHLFRSENIGRDHHDSVSLPQDNFRAMESWTY
ncbi:hypothetical protein AcW2_010332 [Taiwanofungus camphoratus]|nr:hypothetical protein AcW2_010332 [Antrodia cinnamomea]KAI0927860.1 hypothetical protein AcW2_010332 [Antrodia cinnamomea]